MQLIKFSALHVASRCVLALSLPFALWLPAALAQTPDSSPKTVLTTTALPAPSAPTLAPTPPVVVARGPVGVVITTNDLLSELRRAPEVDRQAALSRPETLQQLANNLLVRRMLAAEAEHDGLGADPIVAATLTIARDRALSDARLAQLDAKNAPNDAVLDAYARNVYQANAQRFEVPAQTRARHILLDNSGPESLQKAKALLAQLRAGASFEDLAKANSTDKGSAVRGGDLGFFAAGQMVRPFEDAVNALTKPGELSEPVESQFGYHIIRLEERKEKRRQTYEEVRPQLLAEARTALLNESRVLKVKGLSKDFVFERAAIEAMSQTGAR